jgi:hypothetical protein
MPAVAKPPTIKIQKVIFGQPEDASRSRDARNEVQALVNGGVVEFPVGQLNAGGDPAYQIVKTLMVDYTADGLPFKITGREPDSIYLGLPISIIRPAAQLRSDNDGQLSIVASLPGKYEVKTARGKTQRAEISTVPPSQEIVGAWNVSFPPKWGAPERITLDKLTSLSESTNAGVKYFSGTATYTKTFDWKPTAKSGKQKSEIWLELGEVHALAQVNLNGRNLGTVWQPPYRVNITDALQAGPNALEVRVANLWRNRLIGDAALPMAERFTWSSSAQFSPDTPLPESGLLGPVTIHTMEILPLTPTN